MYQEDFSFDWEEMLREINAPIEKLEVVSYEMTHTGKLEIIFNRPFILDARVYDKASQSGRRALNKVKVALEDFISVKVVDVEDDDLNRKISKIYIENVTTKSIEFGIEYEKAQDISADLREPDTLAFEFELPWMIRDEETKEVLNDFNFVYEVELQP